MTIHVPCLSEAHMDFTTENREVHSSNLARVRLVETRVVPLTILEFLHRCKRLIEGDRKAFTRLFIDVKN